MRMTLHTDYALRMLIYTALRPASVATISDIAKAYALSRNHLLKVALTLRDIGLIETVRGRSGGIRLARDPREINIGTVVRLVEEDFAVVECLAPGGGSCAITPACRLKRLLREALAAYLAVLDQYTLADIVRHKSPLLSLLGIEADNNGPKPGKSSGRRS